MKRNLKLQILAIITVLMLVVPIVPVMATSTNTDVARIGNTSYTTFEEALQNVTLEDNKIVLLANVTLTDTVNITENLIIDLNGNKITGAERLFSVQGCEFTVTGTGSLEETAPNYAPIVVKGSNNVADKNYTIVNVGKDVTLKGWAGLFVTPYSSTENCAYGIVINCDGKINSVLDTAGKNGHGLYVNGKIQHIQNAPTINISKTAQVTSQGTGIYAAGYAVWNINGANISGEKAGLAIKSGIFNNNDAVISSTGEDSTPTSAYSNGINASGAAIQIESNNDYAGQIELNIENGTFTSTNACAFYEYVATDTAETAVKSLSIENGNFVAATGKNVFKVSQQFTTDITKFITGGTYSSDVTNYLADGYVCKKLGNNHVVGIENEVTLVKGTVESGTITTTTQKALQGETVELVIKAKEGYEFKTVTVKDALKNVIEVKDGKFVMPNSAVTVEATFEKLTQKTEVPTIDPTQEVQTPVVGVTDEEKVNDVLLDALKEAAVTDETLARALETQNVEVVVDLKEVEINENLQKEVDELLKDKDGDVKIAKFFDVSLLIKANGQKIGELTELGEAIEFTIQLPEDLQVTSEGTERVFYIVREHNGEYELIEATLSEDGKYLTFSSDKFSFYTLAYVDVASKVVAEKDDTPKTGDIVLEVCSALAIISVVGIIVFAKNNKKSRK